MLDPNIFIDSEGNLELSRMERNIYYPVSLHQFRKMEERAKKGILSILYNAEEVKE